MLSWPHHQPTMRASSNYFKSPATITALGTYWTLHSYGSIDLNRFWLIKLFTNNSIVKDITIIVREKGPKFQCGENYKIQLLVFGFCIRGSVQVPLLLFFSVMIYVWTSLPHQHSAQQSTASTQSTAVYRSNNPYNWCLPFLQARTWWQTIADKLLSSKLANKWRWRCAGKWQGFTGDKVQLWFR